MGIHMVDAIDGITTRRSEDAHQMVAEFRMIAQTIQQAFEIGIRSDRDRVGATVAGLPQGIRYSMNRCPGKKDKTLEEGSGTAQRTLAGRTHVCPRYGQHRRR